MTSDVRKDILRSVHNYLKKEGFKDFRSELEDTNNPKKIVEERTGHIFQPDMVATQDEIQYIFEIAEAEHIDLMHHKTIKKWCLFEKHAASKNGKLYLIVPVQHFDKLIRLINRNNLEKVGILQISAC
jgi:hypothetical protein